MRISDLIMALDERPTHIVDATHGRQSLLRYLAAGLDMETVGLDDVEDEWPVSDDSSVVVLVAVRADDNLNVLLRTVLGRVDKHGGCVTVLLLLPDQYDRLRVGALMELRDAYDLEVLAVEALEYETLRVGITLRRATASTAGIKAQLLLERFTAAAIEQRVLAAERQLAAIANLRQELDRRGDRITELVNQVEEFQALFEKARARQGAADVALQSEAERLRKRVVDLEQSTSYRLGHGIIRVVKAPLMLRRLSVKLRVWMGS